LNIPSYKNQEKVNEQSLSLLTLLVNIYVFIFLAIGILAVLISNSIIRPLALLSRRLGDTTLGRPNAPLEWDSQDEIGEIIQAYNAMLANWRFRSKNWRKANGKWPGRKWRGKWPMKSKTPSRPCA
jgi:two-component system nitrogen regulation sensor histidine kinase NtrY